MTIFRRFWFFVTRWRRLDEIDEEMRLHVHLRAAANRRDGLDPDEATRQAKVRFGNPLSLREDARNAWGYGELDRIVADLRQATRRVVHHPARTLVVVLTLALGIGATTAMFTLVDTMLFKTASWNRDGKLVWVAGIRGRSGTGRVLYPDYLVYRDRATTLSGAAAYNGTAMSIGGPQPQRVLGGLVSGNFFDVLGIRAQLGRTFAPDEDSDPGGHPVVVLSDSLWRTHFGGDPRIIDTEVAINARPFTIVGIAPPGFTGVAYAGDPEQLWIPLAMERTVIPRSSSVSPMPKERWVRVVGRLRDHTTAAEADAEMRVIARGLNPPGTPANQEKSARAVPIRGGLTPWEQDSLTPMFALVSIVPGLVLLVACANVANVLTAHHLSRRREFALRRAIGATRGRLIRQLLAESFVLSVLAGAAGFGISFGLSGLIAHYGEIPADVTRLLTPATRSLLAATAVSIATVLIFGVAPALTATRFDVLPTLKDESTTSTASRGSVRLRRVFVIAQIALSLALVIAAGLFLQSFSRAARVDVGFDPHGLVTMSFDLDLQGYTLDHRASFVSQFAARTSALKDVTSVATADILPFGGEMYGATIVSEEGTTFAQATRSGVSPEYFKTLGLPLVRGRSFTEADITAHAAVAIVNETVAQRLWPGTDPIGKRVHERDSQEPWREIVGIARDANFLQLTESTRGAYYVPLGSPSATFLVRTIGAPSVLISALTNAARSLDPDLPVSRADTMDDRIRRSVNLRRAVVSLLSVLGALTLLLASVGIYGVTSHDVSVRIREVGIRMSLGARGSDVWRMIVRDSLRLSLIGIGVGLLISIGGAMVLASFLFGMTATEPATFLGAAVVLCLVTLAASYIPARRASHLDPLTALRRE